MVSGGAAGGGAAGGGAAGGGAGGAGAGGGALGGGAGGAGAGGGALELRGAGDGLLDEPLVLQVHGAGGAAPTWRARLRDDDGRVWRASADRPERLAAAWAPAKATTGPVAALQSLRPIALELRAEADDGRAAARTVRRRLLADGVRVRRWRDPVPGTLLLPAAATPCAAVVLPPAAVGRPTAAPDRSAAAGPPAAAADPPAAGASAAAAADGGPPAATAPGPPAAATADPRAAGASAAAAALPAAALLASRGAVVFVPARDEGLERAVELLAAVPAAARAAGGAVRVLDAVPLPPGLPARRDPAAAAADAAAWDALLAALGARPRTSQR